MFKTAILPMRSFHIKPTFWGLDRDLRETMDSIENVWEETKATSMKVELKETEQTYFMSIDMPGVNKDNLDIHVEGEQLLINATRNRNLIDGKKNKQKISQTVLIPKMVNKDKIQAHCEDGVLYLALPKLEKAKPKKIEVTRGFKNTAWNNLLDNDRETKDELLKAFP